MAQRVEEFDFDQSCAAGCVSLDLDADSESIRLAAKTAFDRYMAAIEQHFDFGSPKATRSFAGMVLSAIEGAYIRCRAERSSQPFIDAGEWLAQLATKGSTHSTGRRKARAKSAAGIGGAM
jgi:hypothetical protein